MFGSKLRSWMENHIVRPRKKANKNKNANSNANSNSTSAACSSHDLAPNRKTNSSGFTVYNGNNIKSSTTTITASPTHANHNGCNGVISSPARRREVSPIQNHTQSRYGWQSPDESTVTSPKSDNLLYAPRHYQPHHQITRQHHTAPNSKDNSCADKSPPKVNCSSSSISSLSWSTGSKEPAMQTNAKQLPQEIESSQSYTLDNNDIEDPNAVHYEEIGVTLRNAQNISNNNFVVEQQRPLSDQLPHTRYLYNGGRAPAAVDDQKSRYGRLLPSKMQPPTSSESVESLNGLQHMIHADGANFACNDSLVPPNPPNAAGRLQMQRSRLKTGNFIGQANYRQQACRIAGPPHSLSSPESAYSTGYSTDGNSPGANYNLPEYYINMRTGTHYFPKSINSLAIEAQRYKFGLNKIEEMSPLDPLPKTTFGQKSMEHFYGATQQQNLPLKSDCSSPLAMRSTIVAQSPNPTHKIFESPSPRQRCRIRTNPWYSTNDTAFAGMPQLLPAMTHSTNSSLKSATSMTMKMEVDASSTTSSSGVKSSNEMEAAIEKNKQNVKTAATTTSYESSESSSSLTEVENMQRTYSPSTIRRKRSELLSFATEPNAVAAQLYQQCIVGRGSIRISTNEYQEVFVSDDEATLNEMMGKFDESYIYEKETDILSSDSDQTDCASELDTGQDAGDECDTDDLLDIDFIDTSSINEVHDRKELQRNLGSCQYYAASPTRHMARQNFERKSSVRSRKTSRSFKSGFTAQDPHVVTAGAAQRRRKRFMKTRKKSAENRDNFTTTPLQKPRESRSVGGTPVCLRRNHLALKERIYKTSPLSNRSNSLVFTDVHDHRFMAIAESEKALLKADLEADVKYRQLIMEAESLLESMKNSLQSIPRDTPVASPRRLNPLANKRVEMLKHSEVETKRDAQKQAQRSVDAGIVGMENELAAAINKRIELIKLETASAPNSPKLCRLSPRKTHLTNFINQNAMPEVPQRKSSIPESAYKPPQSPQLQLNGRRIYSPSASPHTPRRLGSPRLQHGAVNNYIGSDSEPEFIAVKQRPCDEEELQEDLFNQNYLLEMNAAPVIYDNSDYSNQNVVANYGQSVYCPHSEPLKRKVYKGSSSFERIKKTFDRELEVTKQTKSNLLRQNSTTKLPLLTKSSSQDMNHHCVEVDVDENMKTTTKQQLILSTIVDLKRSLEHQSYELCGLNDE